MATTFLPSSYDDDDERTDRDLVSSRFASSERERDAGAKERTHKEACLPRPGKNLSNLEIEERELRSYAYFLQHRPQFGHPEKEGGSSLRVADEDCFGKSRVCRHDQFYEAQLYQSRFNPFDALQVDSMADRQVDSRRDIRDSRCN